MSHMTEQEFDQAIEMLRSKSSMTYEDGYQWLLGNVDANCEKIVALMHSETDPQMRGKFIEILGYAKSKSVITVLEAELSSSHRDVRFWAYCQLEYSEHPAANEIAKQYKAKKPNEDWY
jgi:hypothetical protein